jgi:hypothetical protein
MGVRSRSDKEIASRFVLGAPPAYSAPRGAWHGTRLNALNKIRQGFSYVPHRMGVQDYYILWSATFSMESKWSSTLRSSHLLRSHVAPAVVYVCRTYAE